MRTFILTILFITVAFQESFSQKIVFRQPSSYVLGFIGNDSISLSSVNYNSFRIYFKDTSYTAKHLSDIQQELDIAYNKIISVLNIAFYNNGIYLLAVDSKEEMQKVMGYKIKGGAAKGHDLGFFVYNQNIRPQFKHEIFHLISFETWGLTNCRLLDEGGATYTDNFCFYDNPMYSINAYYLQQKKLFPLDSLVNGFDNQTKKSDVIAYIQSAGIFKYLYEKYGAEKMKLLWTSGFENFKSIYGFSIQQLETDWLNFIKTVPIPKDFEINKLKEGCG
ncbi:MAG: peptidase MA family metallohydrolase [Bacteroidales bacterium]